MASFSFWNLKSLYFICPHSFSFVAPFPVICCHSLSFAIIRFIRRCHLLSFLVIRCHWFLLDVLLVCLLINDLKNKQDLNILNYIYTSKMMRFFSYTYEDFRFWSSSDKFSFKTKGSSQIFADFAVVLVNHCL